MRIKEKLSQNRRDFWAVFECEACGATVEKSGYDDTNFHQNVIPDMKCPQCGKSTRDIGGEYTPMRPLYPEGMVV